MRDIKTGVVSPYTWRCDLLFPTTRAAAGFNPIR